LLKLQEAQHLFLPAEVAVVQDAEHAEAVEFEGISKRVRNYAPANGIINYHEIELVD